MSRTRSGRSGQGVAPPVEHTIKQIKSFLKQCGGSNSLSRIGKAVQKPKSRKLLKVIRDCPSDFILKRSNQEYHAELVKYETKTVAPEPARVLPVVKRTQEVEEMEQPTKRWKSERLTLNEIIGSFKNHELAANDLSGLKVMIEAISTYPNQSDKPFFVGIDFRRESDVGGRVPPSTVMDFFIGNTKFTFEYQQAAHGQDGLGALLSHCQQPMILTIANPSNSGRTPPGMCKTSPSKPQFLDCHLVAEYLFSEPYLEWENFLDIILKRFKKEELLDANFEHCRKHLFFHLLWEQILSRLSEQDVLLLQTATRNRMLNLPQARYQFGFDAGDCYAICSSTLASMDKKYPSDLADPMDFLDRTVLEEEKDFDTLFECLPSRLSAYLNTWSPGVELLKENITEIVLDLGREPFLRVGKGKIFFCNTPDAPPVMVEQEDIDHILKKGQFCFGPDNRATIPGQLHRIAAMRDRYGKIYCLTLRFGRQVKGNAGLILDIFLEGSNSVLILGPTGSGKTTLVREIARVLSEEVANTVIVDTSNEIGGDGERPHSCVGLARRMMVPSLEQQASVMLECLKNHNLHVMIIDEIGRANEVEAARTIKNRRVQLVASAHGNLRGLVANADLNGLVGVVQAVTIGDGLAMQRASATASKVEKVVTQSVGTPIFDVIIELDTNHKHAWKVITEPRDAVDAILNSGPLFL